MGILSNTGTIVRRAESRFGTVFISDCFFGILSLLGAAWLLMAHGFSASWWIGDKFATFAGEFGIFLVLCSVPGLLILKRWSAAPPLVCGLLLWAMIPMTPRAPWVAVAGTATDGVVVRVMTFNGLASNTNIESIYDLISTSGADVITVIEAPHDLIAMIRERGGVPGIYEYWDAPEPGHWWNVVRLSRWPLSWIEVERDDDFRRRRGSFAYRRSLVVMHPDQPFVLTALFPQSPRSRARWESGNAEVRLFGEVIRECFEPTGLPLVVCADINGSPTGYRTQLIADESGLLRCKPWWKVCGTWPSVLPRILQTPIDDVLVSGGISVRSWESLGRSAGSDHRPVMVELVLEKADVPVPEAWLRGQPAPDRHLGARGR